MYIPTIYIFSLSMRKPGEAKWWNSFTWQMWMNTWYKKVYVVCVYIERERENILSIISLIIMIIVFWLNKDSWKYLIRHILFYKSIFISIFFIIIITIMFFVFAERKSEWESESKFWILFVGSFSQRRKELVYFINTLRSLASWCLEIYASKAEIPNQDAAETKIHECIILFLFL